MSFTVASLATKAAQFRDWQAGRSAKAVEIIDGIATARHLRLDEDGLKQRGWTNLPIDWLPEPGTIYSGGYAEERAIYTSPVFQTEGEEPRTIHLGLDVFAPAGTPVRATLDGRVHSFQVNDNPLDYGPTLILEHALTPDLTIYTLYGHLSAASLNGRAIGQTVDAGDEIAQLGSNDVNGGWAPHLHFQVMLDLLGKAGDFPGVCRKSEARDWLTLCPDPGPLAGLRSPPI